MLEAELLRDEAAHVGFTKRVSSLDFVESPETDRSCELCVVISDNVGTVFVDETGDVCATGFLCIDPDRPRAAGLSCIAEYFFGFSGVASWIPICIGAVFSIFVGEGWIDSTELPFV